jgi:RNA polymerase sigma-32 factor
MRYNPEMLAAQSDHEDTRQTQLRDALTSLDARSRNIIQRRWLDEKKPTLHELADEYGISAERVRQIEMKALDIMKDALAA